MKTILKQMMLALTVLLLAAASGPAQVFSPLYSFEIPYYFAHTVGLLVSGNTIYGTIFGSVYNGSNRSSPNASGVVFKLNTDGSGFTNLYAFSPVVQYSLGVYTNTDGANPEGQLVLSGGRLYGKTSQGGFYGLGIVFAINTDGSGFTNLYNFSASGASGGLNLDPSAGLVLSGNKLYGTTEKGGTNGTGTIFTINTDGTGFTNLYNFGAFYGSNNTNSDGFGPLSPLILSNNTLYGTAYYGGTNGSGTVFRVNTDGTDFTNLHSFPNTVEMAIPPHAYTNGDGAGPIAGLVLSGNTLYGTAVDGGSFGNGTVFAVNTDGTGFTNLHSLNAGDGGYPETGLVLSGNTLYGTALDGGSGSVAGQGTVFAMHTDGTGFATLETFTGGTLNSSGIYTNASGTSPVATLVLSGDTLYGATEAGGANGVGTVFALDLAVAPPTIQFTASPTNGFTRMAVQFTSPAADAGGNPILAWNWNFGDGSNSVSTAQNPTHTYTNAANFLPTLTCINSYGETVVGSGPAITTSPIPPIQFTASPTNGLPPPVTVHFTSPAVDAAGHAILSWNWNFGDGSSNTSKIPRAFIRIAALFSPVSPA